MKKTRKVVVRYIPKNPPAHKWVEVERHYLIKGRPRLRKGETIESVCVALCHEDCMGDLDELFATRVK